MRDVRAICVFCSSSEAVAEPYRSAALDLGRRMGDLGIELVYGGASIGLMGCVARGVHERGGRVVGVLPEFFRKKNIAYGLADELVITRDMRERKAVMDRRADAFIVLPGGIGTLEEAAEILSMKQLRLTDKPLVFIDIDGYFEHLTALLAEMVKRKFAKPETLKLFASAPDAEKALRLILDYEPPKLHEKWVRA